MSSRRTGPRTVAALATAAAVLAPAPAAARRCAPVHVYVRLTHVSGTLAGAAHLTEHRGRYRGLLRVEVRGGVRSYRLTAARARLAPGLDRRSLPAGAPVRLTVRTVRTTGGCSHRHRTTITADRVVVTAPPAPPAPPPPPTAPQPPPPSPPNLVRTLLTRIRDIFCQPGQPC